MNSIAPPEFPDSGTSQLRPLPVAERPFFGAAPEPSCRPPVMHPGDTTAGGSNCRATTPEMSFAKLIAQLSRQLKALEQTFMRALTALARNLEKGVNGMTQSVASQDAVRPSGTNPYDGLIRRAAERHELDPALLSAVVRAESGFDPNAQSSAGAMGLMQLMPETAKSLGVRDPYNPAQNIEGGATLLRSLIDRYDGRLDLALAAYNAGSGAVDKYNGVPPYPETRGYVDTILNDYRTSALGA